MPSLLPGFEYDIFISYRHNDNRSGWVTEFVTALQQELAATIKDPISVYFDTNPHDGLLENHNVDKSLEGKLKCLIFIPVISQTYCDPKSFAWQHEFCAFNKLARGDSFGRDIKLNNGNVASRILPVKIHELEEEDKMLIENELTGVLRSIEFIFKSAGVNRPLTPSDNPEKNINKTFYRDQINKTANAIKEIITGLKNFDSVGSSTAKPKHPYREVPRFKPGVRKLLANSSAVLIILLLAGYFIFNFTPVGKSFIPEPIDKSIAVLPFVDMSPSQNQEYFADGLSEELLNMLAQIPELKVIGRTSSFQFKGKNEDLREIGKKLNVSRLLEGSVRKSETNFRITAQLIDTRDGAHLWSQTYDRKFDDIFAVQDEIASAVVEALKLNMLPTALSARQTPRIEAYNFFLQGRSLYEALGASTDNSQYYFEESIKLDSTFALPWTYLSMCHWRNAPTARSVEFALAKKAAEKSLQLDPSSGIALVNLAEILDNEYDFKGAEEKMQLALKNEPKNPYVLRNAARFYTYLGKTEESISYCKQALQYDPIQPSAWIYLTRAYFYAGRYEESIVAAKKFKTLGTPLGDYDFFYAHALIAQGKFEDALKVGGEQGESVFLAAANFKLGHKKEAMAICNRLIEQRGDDGAFWLAYAFAYGDEPDQVFTWLERAFQNKERDLVLIAVEPALNPFRNDPRFKKLLQKMNFPDI